MAGEFDHGHLHAETNPEERNVVHAGVFDRLDHAFGAALAETARNQDGIEAFEDAGALFFDFARVDELGDDLRFGVDAGVRERFVEGLVAVGVVDVLADHAHRHLALRVLEAIDDVFPGREVGGLRFKTELAADDVVEALGVEHEGHFVDRRSVGDADDAVHRNVREERDLRAFAFGNHAFGAAEKKVGIDAFFTELLHGVLRGLRLQFARRGNPRAEREVNEAGVVAAHAEGHLTDGFDEGERFDVAHRAADFHDRDVGIARRLGAADDVFLDFIGDVRNHLHGLAEVFAAAFLAQDAFVDLPRSEVVRLVHLRGDEAFVVTKVQVGLCAVFRHEHFAVLEGRHRARVHVDVRVELDHRDRQAAGLENGRQRSGGDAFTERGDNAAGDKYILGHEKPRNAGTA